VKVFAVGTITTPPTQEQQPQLMAKEVPHTLQLYLEGKIEQFWFRQDRPGVFFLMNVESIDEAKATVSELPLTEGGFMTFELTPVGPLAPLGRLIQKQ
jgi:muconolactone delta-isomerase